MGSEAMQVELLALFIAEAERLLDQVAAADTQEIRADRLQALAALARSVGAQRLTRTALDTARSFSDGEDLDRLRSSVDEVVGFIRRGSGEEPHRTS